MLKKILCLAVYLQKKLTTILSSLIKYLDEKYFNTLVFDIDLKLVQSIY